MVEESPSKLTEISSVLGGFTELEMVFEDDFVVNFSVVLLKFLTVSVDSGISFMDGFNVERTSLSSLILAVVDVV